MTPEDVKHLAELYINSCNFAHGNRLSDVFDDDSIIYDGETGIGFDMEWLTSYINELRSAFPNIRYKLTEYGLSQNGKVMVRWNVPRGTIPEDVYDKICSHKGEISGMDILEVKNGRVKTVQEYSDSLSPQLRYYARKQLGDAPVEDEDTVIAKNFMKMLEERRLFLDPNIKITVLANAMGLRVNRLSHVVNSTIGKSFRELVNDMRIDEAKKLLARPKASRISITEIAERTGFKSQSVFNVVFKKHTSLTPGEFRESTYVNAHEEASLQQRR